MKQPKVGNFFWFIGVVTTLSYVKKMVDFYLESLDEPRKKNRPILFFYDHQNTNLHSNPNQQPNIKNTLSTTSATVKFKPGKASYGETE